MAIEKGVVTTPPSHLVHGTLDPALVVLTLSVTRAAERLDREREIKTADGPVKGRVGDFVITTASGEQYPILSAVFYGTYRIIGRVGSRLVASRLVHARRAWPIASAHAEFDYGPTRGKVAGRRGGWIYQSDDDDFGLINADAKDGAHVVVGPAEDLEKYDWSRRFHRASTAIAMLPPLMTLIALAAQKGDRLSHVLHIAELAGLIVGIFAVYWIRRQRWAMKAAFVSGTDIARRMQCAVEAISQRPSQAFPEMALWRAAQDDAAPAPSFTRARLRALKDQLYETAEHVRREMQRLHAFEARSSLTTWVSAATVGVCLVVASTTEWKKFALVAIWLPSAVGAVHAWTHRRQMVARAVSAREFLSELSFVREQLIDLAPDDRVDDADQARVRAVTEAVRLLCRVAAEHSQRQMQFAIAEDPSIPV